MRKIVKSISTVKTHLIKKSITAAITRRITTIDMKKIKTPQRPLFSNAKENMKSRKRIRDLPA